MCPAVFRSCRRPALDVWAYEAGFSSAMSATPTACPEFMDLQSFVRGFAAGRSAVLREWSKTPRV
jgi:hypothetical protein